MTYRRGYWCPACDTGLIAGLDEPILDRHAALPHGRRSCLHPDHCELNEVRVRIEPR